MKTLKLNILEKSEMNAVHGGDSVCEGNCLNICGVPHAPNQRGGAPASKTYDQASRHGHIIGGGTAAVTPNPK